MTAQSNNNSEWRGYTLDQLRYRRAATAARNQVEKMMLTRGFADLRRANPYTSAWTSLRGILSSIGYVNSAIMAFRLLSGLRSVWRNLRR